MCVAFPFSYSPNLLWRLTMLSTKQELIDLFLFLPSEVSDIGKKCDDILSPDPVQKIENTLIFFSVNIQ